MIFVSALLFSCSEPTNGVDGLNGEDGVDGTNGFNTLVHSETEPVGENCTTGGTKLSFGLDEDEDGFLDIEEVRNTIYVCNGEDGQDGENGQDGEDGATVSSEDNGLIGTWVKTDNLINITSDTTSLFSESSFVHWGGYVRFLFITNDVIIRCRYDDCDEEMYVYDNYSYTQDALRLTKDGYDWIEFYNFDSSGNTIYFRETITNDSTGLREVWERME
tara:strand:- start:1055 stop:1708 length:654 start_codon:yes stop_codon:yes gene_type:complete